MAVVGTRQQVRSQSTETGETCQNILNRVTSLGKLKRRLLEPPAAGATKQTINGQPLLSGFRISLSNGVLEMRAVYSDIASVWLSAASNLYRTTEPNTVNLLGELGCKNIMSFIGKKPQTTNKTMTRNTRAEKQFLNWIEEQAANYEIELTIDYSSSTFCRESRVLGRLRSTEKSTRFQTKDAADERHVRPALQRRFDRILCVILQLSNKHQFDPDVDHFYPVRVSTLVGEHIGDEHASGAYQLNWDFECNTADRVRDNLQLAIGLPREREPTDDQQRSSTRFQEIARDICGAYEESDE